MGDTLDHETQTLLLLDNCEHIKDIDKARREIYNLLKEYPQLIILATSRAKLSTDENECEVKPFDAPGYKTEPIKILQTNESIQLFIEAARITNKDFALTEQNAETVATLCIALDGLPLALLIIGSWIDQLSEERLHRLLFNLSTPFPYLPHEQKLTLNQAIELSYILLEPPVQKLYRRLGIFTDQWVTSLEIVAGVCSLDGDLPTDPDDPTLLHWLDTLRKHHLITFANERVKIAHKTLHDFAIKRLKDAEEFKQIRKQFVDYYYSIVTKCYWLFDNNELREAEKLKAFLDKETSDDNLIKAYQYALAIRIEYVMDMIRKIFEKKEAKVIEAEIFSDDPKYLMPSRMLCNGR
jgi:hypothetical protein